MLGTLRCPLLVALTGPLGGALAESLQEPTHHVDRTGNHFVDGLLRCFIRNITLDQPLNRLDQSTTAGEFDFWFVECSRDCQHNGIFGETLHQRATAE